MMPHTKSRGGSQDLVQLLLVSDGAIFQESGVSSTEKMQATKALNEDNMRQS
jgi:hypothetical protein